VRGIAIPHPVGDPGEEPSVEGEIREELLEKALRALCEPIKEQTLFE
jgi:glycine reductase